MSNSENEIYQIPCEMRSSIRIDLHICYIFAVSVFPLVLLIPGNDMELVILKGFCLLLSLLFLMIWLHIGILKNAFVKLDSKGIYVKTFFKAKKLDWVDIGDVQIYRVNHNTFIGLTSKEKLKKQKDNFIHFLSVLLASNYSMAISLSIFSKIDTQKLYNTFIKNMGENQENTENYSTIENPVEQEDRSNIIALLRALVVSVLIGFLYGISIYYLNINLLIIPWFGLICIFYVYHKKYDRNTASIISDIILGVLAALQFLIAPYIQLLLYNEDYSKTYGILKAAIDCISFMYHNPGEYVIYYILAVVFFGICAAKSLLSKFNWRRLFRKGN